MLRSTRMSLVDFPNDTKSPVFVTSLKRVKSVFIRSTDDVSLVDFAVEDTVNIQGVS